MNEFRTLVERHLARLASQRLVAVSLVAAILALVMGALLLANVVAQHGTEIDRVSRIRAFGWTRGSGFFEQIVLVIAITLGATQIHTDVKGGALFTVLARPVSRTTVFASGWFASAMLLALLEALRGLTWIGAAYLAGGLPDLPLLVGMAGLVTRDWLLVAIFAALGARLAPAYTVAVGIGLLVIAGIAFGDGADGIAGWLVNGFGSVIPLYGRQESITQCLVGQPVRWFPVGEAIAYQLGWTGLLLCIGAALFERRDLAPRS